LKRYGRDECLKTVVADDGHGVRTRSLQGQPRHRSGKTYRLKTGLTPTEILCEDTLAAGAAKAPQRQDLLPEDVVDVDGHGVRTHSLQGRPRHRSGKTYSLKTWLTSTDMV